MIDSPEKQISCFWGICQVIFLEYPIVYKQRVTKSKRNNEYLIKIVCLV